MKFGLCYTPDYHTLPSPDPLPNGRTGCWSSFEVSFGSFPRGRVMTSLRRFAAEVMPAFA